jgi:hypothetical protein
VFTRSDLCCLATLDLDLCGLAPHQRKLRQPVHRSKCLMMDSNVLYDARCLHVYLKVRWLATAVDLFATRSRWPRLDHRRCCVKRLTWCLKDISDLHDGCS